MSKLINNNCKGLSGFVNIGNTCYMNSILQCLNCSKEFITYFLNNNYLEDLKDNNHKELCIEYHKVMNKYWETNNNIKPNNLKNIINKLTSLFDNNDQHDSQEFLSIFLDLLHTGIKYNISITYTGNIKNIHDRHAVNAIKMWYKIYNTDYSFIIQHFFGQYIQELTCGNCEYKLYNYEPYCILTLPMYDNIYDSLINFTKIEILKGDENWLCEKCNNNSYAKKKINIWKSPNILIIQFKRFNYLNEKNDSYISYPINNLNLKNYIYGYEETDCIYNLKAINCHDGSMSFGHYYSYCMNYINNKWYEYNDDTITEVDNLDDLITNNAYLLFYQKI